MEKFKPGVAIVGLLSAALATVSSCSSRSGSGGASETAWTSADPPKHAIKILSGYEHKLFEVGPMPAKKVEPTAQQQLRRPQPALAPLSPKLEARFAQLAADRQDSLEAIGYVTPRPPKRPEAKRRPSHSAVTDSSDSSRTAPASAWGNFQPSTPWSALPRRNAHRPEQELEQQEERSEDQTTGV
jgi:hypothetical protein